MKFRRLVVLVTSVAFVAGVQPGVRRLLAAPRAPVSGAQGPSVTPTPALGISGTVLGFDRISQVPNQRVQLRSVDKGTIVGKTVTDGSGAFSFAVTEPGVYVVEAVSNDGGIVAVGNPVTLLKCTDRHECDDAVVQDRHSLGRPRHRRRRGLCRLAPHAPRPVGLDGPGESGTLRTAHRDG